MSAAPAAVFDERGIQYWMERVVEEVDRVGSEFAPDPVHDLRVALRRCRAIAEGIRTIDPDPRWKKMRRAAKALFSALGELRDTQVLEEWVGRIGHSSSPATGRLIAYFQQREAALKADASAALAAFDKDQWLRWARLLDTRLRDEPVEPEVFEVVALERLEQAAELQRVASRTRSKASLHAVRIGLKRLRYMVENYLPEHHERWRTDLKELQDLLGEVHDLDVLWATAIRIHAFAGRNDRQQWRTTIASQRIDRVAVYKAKLGGKHSLLHTWRDELPADDALRRAIARKVDIWAGFLDPDPAHSKRVLQASLAIFDRLTELSAVPKARRSAVDPRDLLAVAALSHEVGKAKSKKGARKRAARKLEALDVPPGWNREYLRMAGMICRCHRGELPFSDPIFRRMAHWKKQLIMSLGGILRLAETLDALNPADIHSLILDRKDGYIVLHAQGYQDGERIAAASHLLETACNTPIFVRAA